MPVRHNRTSKRSQPQALIDMPAEVRRGGDLWRMYDATWNPQTGEDMKTGAPLPVRATTQTSFLALMSAFVDGNHRRTRG